MVMMMTKKGVVHSTYLHHCTYPTLTLPTSLYLSRSYSTYITLPITHLLYPCIYPTLTLLTSLYLFHPHTTYLHHCTYPILTLPTYITVPIPSSLYVGTSHTYWRNPISFSPILSTALLINSKAHSFTI